MPLLRILLVDDSTEFLRSAEHFLSLDPSLEVVGLATSGAEALEQTARLTPDLVLMDLSMPGMSGLEATRRLKALTHPPRVVILTLHDEPEYRAALAEARADGFVIKGQLGSELLPLLQRGFGNPDGCG
jgi:DNA-binding NarL/FixJ family response regulator